MGLQKSPQDASISIRVITHNIRTNLNPFPIGQEKPWKIRKNYIINEFNFNTISNQESLICLQEARHGQLDDILAGLNGLPGRDASWTYIGCGRDGGKSGEYSPILYRSAIWENEFSETRWLSDTPSIPSHSWGTKYKRIVTCAIFRHRESNRRILSMNTHLDDTSITSRYKGALLIKKWAYEWLSDPQWLGTIGGVILTGDFNTQSQSNDDAYGVLTAQNTFSDASTHVERNRRYGNVNSWTDFNDDPKDDALYDYILIGPVREGVTPWNVQTYGVLFNKFERSDTPADKKYVFSSDHRSVVVDLELRTSQSWDGTIERK